MIKKFSEITGDEIKYLISHPLTLSEKLDMIYFKIEINHVTAIPLKTPRFNAVSDVDCIINSIYQDIADFAYKKFYPIRNKLVDKYGSVRIGFFYLPVGKTKHIDYTNSIIYKDRKNYKDGWIGLSDIYFYDKSSRDAYTINDVYSDLISNDVIVDKPSIIYEGQTLSNLTEQSVLDSIQSGSVIDLICPEHSTYSGLPVNEIEAYIVKSGSKQWQIEITDAKPVINKDTKKIYRDTVLSSLVHDLLDTTDIINIVSQSKDIYEDKVAAVFEEFMSHTDIFSKITIDPEDLLPPIDGYIGTMNTESFKSETVKTICLVNETAKNILRLFLHTFTNTIFANKFSDLTEHDRIKINELIIALKYRNYADIALSISRK